MDWSLTNFINKQITCIKKTQYSHFSPPNQTNVPNLCVEKNEFTLSTYTITVSATQIQSQVQEKIFSLSLLNLNLVNTREKNKNNTRK